MKLKSIAAKTMLVNCDGICLRARAKARAKSFVTKFSPRENSFNPSLTGNQVL